MEVQLEFANLGWVQNVNEDKTRNHEVNGFTQRGTQTVESSLPVLEGCAAAPDKAENISGDDAINSCNEDRLEDAEIYVTRMLALEGFQSMSQTIHWLHQRTKYWRMQGVDLERELRSMDMTLLVNADEDCRTFVQLYHDYLRASGYLPKSSCFEEIDEDNVYETGITDQGTVLIYADSDSDTDADSDWPSSHIPELRDEIEECPSTVIVTAATSEALLQSLSELHQSSPIALKTHQCDPVQECLTAVLDQTRQRFGGRLKFEGGADGPIISAFTRKMARQCEIRKKGIKTIVKSELLQVYNRQLARYTLMKPGLRSTEGEIDTFDPLFLTAEDLLGPPPDPDALNIAAWDELQEMIGLESVKSSIRSFMNGLRINYYRELQGLPPLQLSLSRIFLGPPGTGKTTVATLYGKILAQLGLLSCGQLLSKNASDFIGNYSGKSLRLTKEILQQAKGKVLLIDEAYMLNPGRFECCGSRQEAIDTIVGEIQNRPGEDVCVILCGYKAEMEDLLRDSNPGLSRRFPIAAAFTFEELTIDQLSKILDLQLRRQSLSVTPEALQVAMDMLILAQQRPNFGNGGEVDNLLSRAKDHFQKRFSTLPLEAQRGDVLLTAEDFDPKNTRTINVVDYTRQLFTDFVGMTEEVKTISNLAERVSAMRKCGADPQKITPFTLVFKGPSGCGKAAFASRVGRLYWKVGLLSAPEIVEVSARDFIGEYIGQTAVKTKKLLDSALGKTLLVKDAQRLGKDRNRGGFVCEAREELVHTLSTAKFATRMLVILSGPGAEIDSLIEANPKLGSLFRTQIQFPPLSSASCLKLLKGLIVTEGVKHDLNEDEPDIQNNFRSLSSFEGWANFRDLEMISRDLIGQSYIALQNTEGVPTVNQNMVLTVLRQSLARISQKTQTSDIAVAPQVTGNKERLTQTQIPDAISDSLTDESHSSTMK